MTTKAPMRRSASGLARPLLPFTYTLAAARASSTPTGPILRIHAVVSFAGDCLCPQGPKSPLLLDVSGATSIPEKSLSPSTLIETGTSPWKLVLQESAIERTISKLRQRLQLQVCLAACVQPQDEYWRGFAEVSSALREGAQGASS